MGPKRFGPKGKLAFSFGNVAQDEGSAMAQYAWDRGWKTSALATDTVIVYFKNVIEAFKAASPSSAGRSSTRKATSRSAQQHPERRQPLERREGGRLRDVDGGRVRGAADAHFGAALTRKQHADPELVAGDGTYWLPKTPKVTNYYFLTFASAFGDDPSPEVNALAAQLGKQNPQLAGTGGFVTARQRSMVSRRDHAGEVDRRAAVAATMEKFKQVPTLSGRVSFSPELHTVFGREYRVIEIQDNTPKVLGKIVAKVVPKID